MPRTEDNQKAITGVKSKRLRVELRAVGKPNDEGDGLDVSSDQCPICYDTFNFKTTLPDCGHTFCFLCIKGVCLRNGTCPFCRKPIERDLFDKTSVHLVSNEASCSVQTEPLESGLPDLRNELEVNDNEAQWFYKSRSRGWWRFEPRQEHDIEAAFSSGNDTYELIIVGFRYILDFNIMRQYRKDLPRSPRWERKIKRVVGTEAIKEMKSSIIGIAGLLTGHKKPGKSSTK